MLSFGTPRLVWVKRNRDNRVATRISSDAGAEPLNAHGLLVGRRRPGWDPATTSTAVADVLPGRLRGARLDVGHIMWPTWFQVGLNFLMRSENGLHS